MKMNKVATVEFHTLSTRIQERSQESKELTMLLPVDLNRSPMGRRLKSRSQGAKSKDWKRAGSHIRSVHKASKAECVTSGQLFYFLSICKGNKMLRAGRISHMYNTAINLKASNHFCPRTINPKHQTKWGKVKALVRTLLVIFRIVINIHFTFSRKVLKGYYNCQHF